MAFTFLQVTNNSLTRLGIIHGDADALTTFTDAARQREIDVLHQVWNEAIIGLYDKGSFQGEVAEGTITLVTGDREYALASAFEQLAGDNHETRVLVNVAANHVLHEYDGGYWKMYADQPDPSDLTGQASRFTINPVNDTIRLDTTPTSSENDDVYTYLYDKRVGNLSATDASFPFSDSVVDALLPLVVEVTANALNAAPMGPVWAQAGFAVAVRLATQTKR